MIKGTQQNGSSLFRQLADDADVTYLNKNPTRI